MKAPRILIFLGVALLLLSAVLVPALKPAKIRSVTPCSLNLKLIQTAKIMCAQDHGLTNNVAFTREQLLPYGFGGKWPQCPGGGQYVLGKLHESPQCSCPGHAALRVAAQ